MKKRPISVILISILFMATGLMGIVYHASELRELATNHDAMWVLAVRLLAILGGVFLLRGANWARWLLVLWIVYHVIISFYHTNSELIMHAVIMVLVILALFHPKANTYFRKR